MGIYKTGTYVKGDQTRLAETPADAVAAVYDGFKLREESDAVPDAEDESPENEEVDESSDEPTEVSEPGFDVTTYYN